MRGMRALWQDVPQDPSIDHVGVAVRSLERSTGILEAIVGTAAEPIIELPEQGVRVAFVGGIELLEPLGSETPVGRFLEKRGPGLHHVALRVADLEAELRRLRREGVRLLDPEPRRGVHGLIAFLHPKSADSVLVELVQRV